ncbi:PREDICTED: thaumatin-like protein 1 [Camelina sativa]|uniref:Thaumatin-like protein 1 n=1 Tax=Camelina sativa TaxID=90675 RepID=A0ABM0Y8R7_CAMSA|nr:PREDICTED: thaumatin-like protein 1 [Camelina sativa]
MLVVPQGGSGLNCSSTGCVVDLNGSCPSELKVTSLDGGGKQAMGCKSACEAFRTPEYCCSGAYGTPDTCKPSSYSAVFKTACPRAYSYAYDDQSSTFTCADSPNYVITFCPSPNTSQKSSQDQSPDPKTTTPSGTTTPAGDSSSSSSTTWSPVDTSMIYEGALDQSKGSPSSYHVSSLCGITVTLALAFCRMWSLF